MNDNHTETSESKRFNMLELPEAIQTALHKQNIQELTPVQSNIFQAVMSDQDLNVCSETGSGKTLAYLLPLFCKGDFSASSTQYLILAPTEELAIQIGEQIRLLSANTAGAFPFSCALLLGEGNSKRQIEALKAKPHFVIGTPGRVKQMIESRKFKVHTVKALILDETDKLSEKSYREDVEKIRKSLLKYTQILCFSASHDKKSEDFTKALSSKAGCNDIYLTSNIVIPALIEHHYVICTRKDRITALRSILSSYKNKKIIVFLNQSFELEDVTQKLNYHHYKVSVLSGKMDKLQRKKQLQDFTQSVSNILLTTDLAARGLQIADTFAVINFILPSDHKDYQHRCGRCGRNGNHGICFSLISEQELPKIHALENKLKIKITAWTTADASRISNKNMHNGFHKSEDGLPARKPYKSHSSDSNSTKKHVKHQ